MTVTQLEQAQKDMRFAYLGGAPGMLASGVVWAAAAMVALRGSMDHAVWTLFAGGMFIHPAGVLIARLLGRPGAHVAGNPLGRLALESTGLLIFCLPIAYVVSRSHPGLFFPAMMLIIGGRYLVFASLYGLRLYWACGLALGTAAWLLAAVQAAPPVAALGGSAIELGFAAAILWLARVESGRAAVPAA
jgi:hypothetical protein